MSEFYEESLNTSKNYFDRYKNCSILKNRDSGDTILATREIFDIPPNVGDKYHTVEMHEVNRLDIIADRYYRNPLLWWIIAQANNIVDPFQSLTPGDVLRIPGIETLYGNRGILL